MQIRFMSAPKLAENAQAIRNRIRSVLTNIPAEFEPYSHHAEIIYLNFDAYYAKYANMIPSTPTPLTQQQQDVIILRMVQALDCEWKNNSSPRSARPI